MDARKRRSREKLARAVLDLAEREGIEQMSMVTIAQEAGVNRSTVYEHASSPVDLLRLVLRDELDDIRARHLQVTAADDVREAIRRTAMDVLAHIDARGGIYGRALGSTDSAALHGMLSGHFRESVLLLLSSGALQRPDTPGIPAELQDETVARFVADGTVGAVDAWLLTDPPRDVNTFMTLYIGLLPSWWPLD